MTVPVNDRRIQYTATLGQTVFPYDFKIFDDDDIIVQQTFLSTGLTSTLTKTTDYGVSGVGVLTGGNITLTTGASAGDIITIIGDTPLIRSADYQQTGDFTANSLNNEFDRIWQVLQQNDTQTLRSVLLDDADSKSSMTLPLSSELANKFLGFDANGDPIVATGITGVPVTPYIATLFDDTTAEEARDTLELGTADNVEFANITGDDLTLSGNVECVQITATTYVGLPNADEDTLGVQYSAIPSDKSIIANNDDTDHDISISAGVSVLNDGLHAILSSILVKQIDANWVAGTNAGGFPSGLTLQANTWYRVFVIYNPTTDTVDGGFDTSDTATNLLTDATGYTKYSHRGWVLTDGSSNIIKFYADVNGRFIWDVSIRDFTGVPFTGASDKTVSAPKNSLANVYVYFLPSGASGFEYGIITETRQTNTAPTSSLYNIIGETQAGFNFADNKPFELKASPTSTLRLRFTTTSGLVELFTTGWKDLEIK